MLTRLDLNELAGSRAGPHVSLYLPLRRRGRDVLEDQIRARHLLEQARDVGAESGVARQELDRVLGPIAAQTEDSSFWWRAGGGLALLSSENGVRAFHMPREVEELAFVGDRFCVRPLLDAVADPAVFYVLAVSQNDLRLVECDADGARVLDLPGVPSSIDEALGYDWEQEALQFHTGAAAGAAAGGRPAVFHGQGRTKDVLKTEIEDYLRIVDHALLERLPDRGAPLVVSAVDYLIPIYHRVSRHPNLVPGGLEGNRKRDSAEALRERALPLVEPLLASARASAVQRLREAAHSDHVAKGIEQVLADAQAARIGVLMAVCGSPCWGRLNGDGPLSLHDRRRPGDDDLLDRAISGAITTGAEVYSAAPEEMPGGARVAALRRF